MEELGPCKIHQGSYTERQGPEGLGPCKIQQRTYTERQGPVQVKGPESCAGLGGSGQGLCTGTLNPLCTDRQQVILCGLLPIWVLLMFGSDLSRYNQKYVL